MSVRQSSLNITRLAPGLAPVISPTPGNGQMKSLEVISSTTVRNLTLVSRLRVKLVKIMEAPSKPLLERLSMTREGGILERDKQLENLFIAALNVTREEGSEVRGRLPVNELLEISNVTNDSILETSGKEPKHTYRTDQHT